MSLGCKCDLGLSNTGMPNCITIQSVTSKLILVPLFNNSGSKNYLGQGFTIDENTITGLLNASDASQRWFPLGTFENVTMEKAESSFEEAPSGKKVFIKQGKRSFAGELWSATPTLLGKIQDNRCVEFGVYIVDVNGNLIGSYDKEYSRLYPIPVDNQSFDARLMYATDTTVQKIMVAFDFDRLFDESTLWMITPADADNYNFNNVEGLLDVNLTKVSATQTTTVLKANLDYGTGKEGIGVKGLVQADFKLQIVSTGNFITLSSVSSVDNQYTLTFPSQTAGALVNISVAKTGYVGTLTTTLN
jgi:hypothetical protein